MSANGTEDLAPSTAELYSPATEAGFGQNGLTSRQRKALRQALARRRLEIHKEQEWLREAIYDVLEDSDAVH